jgi:hypothetical protein
MRSLFAIVLKNLVLLVLITISLVFIFTKYIGFKEVNYIFLSAGFIYVLAACYEAYQLSSIKTSTQKFVYFTDGFVAKRILKIIIFVSCGVVLYISGSLIKYLAFLCFLIAFTEIVVTIWRKVKRLCFVALQDSAFIISTNKLNTMYAQDIVKIETRHGITYVIHKNNTSFTLRTDMMREKDAFAVALKKWVTSNGLESVVEN